MTVNCFIQARSTSDRLPGKVTMPINGIPLIVALYRRLEHCRTIRSLVVITPKDDPVSRVVGINTYSPDADESDLAMRFLESSYRYPCTGFVRVCADSPFVSPGLVDLAAEGTRDYPYVKISGGRSGLQVEGFRAKDFSHAVPYMTDEEREHIGLFFQRGRSLCIDTAEDYERLKDVPL